MEMQDKEFDQIFNSKLNNFEVEPSTTVWDNITAELDGKKESKRSLVPYLSIAASVIILIAASVLFLSRDIKKEEDEPVKIVKGTKRAKEVLTADTNNVRAVKVNENINLTHVAAITPTLKEPSRSLKTNNDKAGQQQAPQQLITQQPEQTFAAVQTDKPVLLPPAVSDNAPDFSTTTLVNQPKPIMEPPVGAIIDPIFENVKPKKRAHGLGGIINTIVAVVDKRDDKLIEFADSENDEGAKVAAVNLGIFKIRKQ